MVYQNIKPAVFLRRPNRFIAEVELEGNPAVCHVKNTGRCRELLVPGARVYVQDCPSPARKTRYDLIAVAKGDRLVNIDSQAPNKVVGEWLAAGGLFQAPALIKPEYRFRSSRLDFYVEAAGRKCLLEVKGVTLARDGAGVFPDAPTQRGARHVRTLLRAAQAGYGAYVLFVAAMEHVTCVRPNWKTDQAFAQALVEAQQAGVTLLALRCKVEPDAIAPLAQIPVCLDA